MSRSTSVNPYEAPRTTSAIDPRRRLQVYLVVVVCALVVAVIALVVVSMLLFAAMRA